MKTVPPTDSAQAMQRVRVGMTGLAMVLVVIGLASAIFSSATNEPAVTAIGASNSAVVANMTDGNTVVANGKQEPQAELGVAPGTVAPEAVNTTTGAKK